MPDNIAPHRGGGLELYREQDRQEVLDVTEIWLAGMKPATRDNRRHAMRLWSTFCQQIGLDPLEARLKHANLFRVWLSDPSQADDISHHCMSDSSVANMMSGVSAWYTYLQRHELHDYNPMALAERPAVDRHYTATPFLSEEEAATLLDAAAISPQARNRERDIAQLHLMLHLGIRVSEVTKLTIAQLVTLKGRRAVNVLGKGNKRVYRALPPCCDEAIAAYLPKRIPPAGTARTRPTGALFTRRDGTPTTRQGLYRRVVTLARQAGMVAYPHVLRHTFATVATDHGAELDDLQAAMGHTNPATTRRYQHNARRIERDPSLTVAAAMLNKRNKKGN